MIKKLAAAIILTVPVYAFVVGGDLVSAWFVWGNGWEVFGPLVDMLGGGQSAIAIIMLTISFLISLCVVIFVAAYSNRKRTS